MSGKNYSFDRIATEWETRQQKNKDKAVKALPMFFKLFTEKNIMRGELEYRGCGDSGEAWDWTFYDDENNKIEISSWSGWKKQDHEYEVLGISKSDLEPFDEHVEHLLYYDWVNNEGGGGKANIDFKKMTISIDAHSYETREVDASDQIETEYKFNEST